jgi:hypothetical protein
VVTGAATALGTDPAAATATGGGPYAVGAVVAVGIVDSACVGSQLVRWTLVGGATTRQEGARFSVVPLAARGLEDVALAPAVLCFATVAAMLCRRPTGSGVFASHVHLPPPFLFLPLPLLFLLGFQGVAAAAAGLAAPPPGGARQSFPM